MKGKKHFNYSLSSHIKTQTIRIEAGADLGTKKIGRAQLHSFFNL